MQQKQAFVTTQPYEITQVGEEEEASSFACFAGKRGLYMYLCPHLQLSLSHLLSVKRIIVLPFKNNKLTLSGPLNMSLLRVTRESK